MVQALDYRLGSVFSCVVSVSAGLGLAFYYGWQLALLLVAIFPLLGVGHGLQMKYLRGRLEKDKRETENAGKVGWTARSMLRQLNVLAGPGSHREHSHGTGANAGKEVLPDVLGQPGRAAPHVDQEGYDAGIVAERRVNFRRALRFR